MFISIRKLGLLAVALLMPSMSASAMSAHPAGYVDGRILYTCTVYGWAADADFKGNIPIEIYRGGEIGSGGILAGVTTTGTFHRGDGLPGYLWTLPENFNGLAYVYAVDVNAFGSPQSTRVLLQLWTPNVPNHQVTCTDGPRLDEGPRAVALSGLSVIAEIGEIEQVIRRGDAGIIAGAPDGHISAERWGGKSKVFFTCVGAAGVQHSCLTEPGKKEFKDSSSVYQLNGIYRAVMDGPVPGSPTESRYAAMTSTWRNPQTGVIHGWYHAEVWVNPDNHNCGAYGSASYAISTDNGRSFIKQGPVVTSSSPRDSSVCNGQGVSHPWVIESGGYLYMIADAWYPDWTQNGVILARASKLNPGVWFKYRNGQFTEPGIGGNATRIISQGGPDSLIWHATVYWNSYLNRFLMVHTDFAAEGAVFLRHSADLMNWSSPQLLIPAAENWNYRYPSFLSNNMDRNLGRVFWLYGARTHRAGATGWDSLLYRRRIELR